MLVVAVKDNIKDLPKDLKDKAFNQSANGNGNVSLTIGKKYIVAGIAKKEVHKFYLIVYDYDEPKSYPWWYPSELFEIVDDKIPDDWVKEIDTAGSEVWSFPELSQDPTGGRFESNLEDGEPKEIGTFLRHYNKYKEQYEGENKI